METRGLVTQGRFIDVGGIDPVGETRAAVTFTVDLLLADPFFYGPVASTVVPLAAPTTSASWR